MNDYGWVYRAVIPGPPIGKGRPRHTKEGRVYTPKRTVDWEKSAAYLMGGWWHEAPYEGKVGVRVYSYAVRPGRLLRKKDAPGPVWKGTTPDVDNVAKSVLDAIQMAGVIRQDNQVVYLEVRDMFAEKDGVARVELELFPIQDPAAELTSGKVGVSWADDAPSGEQCVASL